MALFYRAQFRAMLTNNETEVRISAECCEFFGHAILEVPDAIPALDYWAYVEEKLEKGTSDQDILNAKHVAIVDLRYQLVETQERITKALAEPLSEREIQTGSDAAPYPAAHPYK